MSTKRAPTGGSRAVKVGCAPLYGSAAAPTSRTGPQSSRKGLVRVDQEYRSNH